MIRVLTILLFCGVSFGAYSQYATRITVAKNGTGDFQTIQAAIEATKAFPDLPITIFVKRGIYEEKVRVYAWNNNLSIIGEDRDSTIITWNDHFEKINLGRNSTFHTYTLQVEANDVTMENLTIQNTAGPVGQAVALHLDGDRVAIRNCIISGNQDTVYLAGEGFRQYFQNCRIEGTTDFIFGAATAVFSKCIIHSKADSYITAASTPAPSDYGLVFIECKLTADEEVSEVLLGRPWRAYAKTVFISCNLDDHILPQGWDNWGSNEKEKSVFYAEYASSGPGAHPEKRVIWSYRLTEKEASSYTIERIFGNWRP